MVIWHESIERVLNRIFLDGLANHDNIPKIYWEVKEALAKLDKLPMSIYAQSDANAPLGWRRNNYLILSVGYLKFSYTRQELENGERLIVVHEVADSNGNILTENNNVTNKIRNMNNKKVVRLTESQLHNIIAESVSQILEAWDGEKIERAKQRFSNFDIDPRHMAARARGVNSYGKARPNEKYFTQQMARDKWNEKYANIDQPNLSPTDSSKYYERMTNYSNSPYTINQYQGKANGAGVEFGYNDSAYAPNFNGQGEYTVSNTAYQGNVGGTQAQQQMLQRSQNPQRLQQGAKVAYDMANGTHRDKW